VPVGGQAFSCRSSETAPFVDLRACLIGFQLTIPVATRLQIDTSSALSALPTHSGYKYATFLPLARSCLVSSDMFNDGHLVAKAG